MKENKMRLDRFLAAATGCSRAQAAQWVRAGRVRVGESIAREPSRHVTDGEGVWLDEAPLRVEGPRYFLLHKPAGYVCSHRDEGGHLSALRLLDVPRREDLHFAGRLDADTTGLVLLTDDGAWSHRISAPRRACVKVYRAELAEPLVAGAETALAEGLMLHGETRPTRPARLERLSPTLVRLFIDEGRYHQVKRMFAALGNRVLRLHREQVGSLTLEQTPQPGQWRVLCESERDGV